MSIGLEEQPNDSLGYKKFFLAKTPGTFKLTVSSILDANCKAEIDLKFTGSDLSALFPIGTYYAISWQDKRRDSGDQRFCSNRPEGDFAVGSQSSGEGRFQITINGTSKCLLESINCNNLVVEVFAKTQLERSFSVISGNCSFKIDRADFVGGDFTANLTPLSGISVSGRPRTLGAPLPLAPLISFDIDDVKSYKSQVHLSLESK